MPFIKLIFLNIIMCIFYSMDVSIYIHVADTPLNSIKNLLD